MNYPLRVRMAAFSILLLLMSPFFVMQVDPLHGQAIDTESPDSATNVYLPLISSGSTTVDIPDTQTPIQNWMSDDTLVLYASGNSSDLRIPAPVAVSGSRVTAPQTANIQINYNAPSCGSGLPPWPAAAQSAFAFAAGIWGAQLDSTSLIQVDACWVPGFLLPPGVLGAAAAFDFAHDFPNALFPQTNYPIALANTLAGSDLNASDAEIFSFYNASEDWYYGTDGNTPANQFDFVTVALHELGHGLGFSGSMRVLNNGQGVWNAQYPSIYDRFTKDGNGNTLLRYVNDSVTLADALTGKANGVFFDGTNAFVANGGTRIKLYSPSDWQQGSSYSHLDLATFTNTPSALMRPALDFGVAIHDPGPVTLGIFEDLGWVTTRNRIAPDLVIDAITVISDTVEVVIGNQGTGPVLPNQGFWVDLYINPTDPPQRVNDVWNSVGSEGLVWGVDNAALVITPGMTLTLSIDDQYYRADQSNFSGTIPAGTVLYGQVDSANAETAFGGVIETHELAGGAYNNIAGPVQHSPPVTTTVTAAAAVNTATANVANAQFGNGLPSRE